MQAPKMFTLNTTSFHCICCIWVFPRFQFFLVSFSFSFFLRQPHFYFSPLSQGSCQRAALPQYLWHIFALLSLQRKTAKRIFDFWPFFLSQLERCSIQAGVPIKIVFWQRSTECMPHVSRPTTEIFYSTYGNSILAFLLHFFLFSNFSLHFLMGFPLSNSNCWQGFCVFLHALETLLWKAISADKCFCSASGYALKSTPSLFLFLCMLLWVELEL